jgi:hypothetical protein
MRYTHLCSEHGLFTVQRSIKAPSQSTAPCPTCGNPCPRNYRADLAPVHYNAQGFHATDYWKGNVGNQTADKKEWLNESWSKYYNEDPPKPDSIGTYDALPKK